VVKTISSASVGGALAEEADTLVPKETQGQVRRLLNDPTAELFIWCGKPVWAYTDVEGRRREPGDVGAGQAVLPLELRGRPLAAIVHDEALLTEPELLSQVAAAVALELERDRMLFSAAGERATEPCAARRSPRQDVPDQRGRDHPRPPGEPRRVDASSQRLRRIERV
jgi:hypothetical protein